MKETHWWQALRMELLAFADFLERLRGSYPK